ncbi:hypothetical protein A2634_01215 [Candidatus Amesbacteria bacterium RIFCSPHIGHO2_01_FULL_48_32]|uniref:tRNA-guanine(15) transglycosylase-like domain-containing protein n=1 Tax=Candidatus Amesbacteria bacterium RIFCSPLOWO2_01_FULL_48_25 TaxID=1797259 RepID=A0A1F4ZBS0_9BACT|nr:MAG: hypothetical protein A2634_01215 [Candidatus Amesbacteria bacterium RIFCSPHIGHO2_01_FULL_48_32]OGD03661.1 MAG: hypothetical protein A2989_03200 [Candidatus Amesbacteria bacterium RIFCSPLOWO2_01_FULL_48_25]HJZ05990.1 tRNA guanosine(34) transglycosylase Tgt [Patescibacteria group bacterium]
MVISTPHGNITAPVFMPVGTAASVKSLSSEDLESVGAQIILANNYHLYLRPGPQNIKKLGGIHTFMNWPHPILTDSGGFQIMSLTPRITDKGAYFKSHLDGSLQFLSPETTTLSQIDIGANIIMAFDHPIPAGASHAYAKEAMLRTHAWLLRCIKTWKDADLDRKFARSRTPLAGVEHEFSQDRVRNKQALFGIIQGGQYPDLLKESTKFIVDQDLPGIAIGGAVIGSNPSQTSQALAIIRDLLPKNKPLYTMGVGVKPSDIVSVIRAGADMFDCVAPTRLARCGLLYNRQSKTERLDISKSQFKLDKNPIDDTCDCSTCRDYSRSYLHHLFKSHELLYYRLASIHNLRVMIRTTSLVQSL